MATSTSSKIRSYLTPVAVIAALSGLASVRLEVPQVTIPRPAIESRDRFFGIETVGDQVVWVVGKNGKVLRSEDAGASWTVQEVPVNTSCQDIAAWNESEAVAVCNEGIAMHTSDGGRTWTEVELPVSEAANGKVFRVTLDPRGWAWAPSEFNVLMVSKDRGRSWERATADDKDSAWNALAFASEERGCAVGELGTIACTSDGGSTWEPVDSGTEGSLYAIAFRDEQHGVAVGMQGLVVRTEDGGETWQRARTGGMKYHLFDVLWDGSRWVAVGDHGLLAFGSADGATWEVDHVTPSNFNWHTAMARGRDGYYFAGLDLGYWSNGGWTPFGEAVAATTSNGAHADAAEAH